MATPPLPPNGEIVLYQTEDGQARIECRFLGDTLWLSQALLAELFEKDVRTINEHLQNIFEEGELDPGSTIRKFRIVRVEGNREVGRLIEHYSLDAILAKDWETKLNEFLVFNERAVLPNAGSISKDEADARAEAEYEQFAARQRAILEAEGQRTNLKSLEDTAKARPPRKKRPPKKPDTQE